MFLPNMHLPAVNSMINSAHALFQLGMKLEKVEKSGTSDRL
jgi:hypothetical protein